MSESKESHAAATPRAPRGLLARILAVAYLVVIAYTSLQPFRGWWIPAQEIRGFLWAPWPRYITLEDVVVNVAAYAPLGFLLARAFMARLGIRRAVFVAAALSIVTSIAMECVQMFMSSRVASNVDVLSNGLGGVIGALASPLFAPTRGPGMRLARLRQQWFAYGLAADVGIVLICIWLVTQFHPNAQLFGTGNLRDTFDLPAWGIHTPQLLIATEAAVAGLNLIGVGLVLYALGRPTVPRGFAVTAVLAVGLAGKTLAAFTFARGAAPLAWVTPGVLIGVLASAVVLYGLTHTRRRVQWIVAGVSFAAAVAVINIAPDNPYQTVPPQLLAGPTHMLSFSAIVRALSELWPFLAIIYTATAARDPPAAYAGQRPRTVVYNASMSYYERHVFFCCNQRENDARCCACSGAQEMRDYAKQRVKSLKLSGQGKVRVNNAGCLDRCDEGPVMVIYPEAVWYTYVDREDIDEIISEHLENGRVVERLRI